MDTRFYITPRALRQSSRRWISSRGAALALAAASLCIASPYAEAQNVPAPNAAAPAGEAIRLRTKWTAGERLDYEMRLDGTMNMQASPNAAGNPFAGIPLDIEIKMSGAGALEALSVDEGGTARVVPRLNALKLNAESFGQRAALNLQDGNFAFSFNGRNVGRGNANANERNGAFLSNPPFALEISDRGRIIGAVQRDDKGNAKEPEAGNAAPNAGAQAAPGLDWARLAQSMFWRAIPTLWPTMPVKSGDTWNSDVVIPLPAAEAPNGLAPQNLGRFDFTMRGLEDVGGRRVARVSVKGGLDLDAKTARAIGEAAKQEGAQVAPEAVKKAEAAAKEAQDKRKGDFSQQLNKASQRVEGDLWVDPANGHIVRAELTLDTQTAALDVPREGVKPRTKPGDSFFDFSGTLQMQLKNRTVKPAG